ncbi:dimethylhistidine N-methyltransferase [Ekhidna lutea]|uniref:Dimethylhistidine N-methyltransferase n=1 Tax=Ekhidna lutea TaxID=447679 RepID=A0A239J1A8_EKHLU|nr:L-histidine N(alpha)-methyltransferase [Ekhidna lutea]SNS99545.1 dimethylhistidine N-methyltransferase [Ekhidna lutea]
MTKEISTLTPFAEDVMEGLMSENKHLPSKYFYDAKGDSLFQQIMHLDEYYLTRKELEIFETHKAAILEAINGDNEPLRIIELGAGDGLKTKVLLKYFLSQGVDFIYTPVDISGNVLEILEQNLTAEIPGLKIETYEGDYFDALKGISERPEKDIVFFLGSNVGNFSREEAEKFLSDLQKFLKAGDLLFMGVDLKKDPAIILNAYNDSQGVTREFNLNLLDRINTEMGANFDRDQFLHYPYYNPHTGECRSYLISKSEQEITFEEESVVLRAWEAIFMEISKKYDRKQLEQLAKASGFCPVQSFLDSDNWFADVLWQKEK